MTIEKNEVCTQCPNHCPITALRCPRGRRAMLGEMEYGASEGRHHHGGHEGHEGHEGHGGHGRHGGYGEHAGHRGRGFDEDSLSGLMHACGHHLHHRGRHGGGQGSILTILSEKASMSQKELQDILRIQPGSLSEILTKLEQKGMITREKDEEDKRKSVISLTEAGKAAVHEQTPRMDEKEMFDVLSEEEQTELKRLLKKLISFWKA